MKTSLCIFGILLAGLAFGQDLADDGKNDMDIEDAATDAAPDAAPPVTTDTPTTTPNATTTVPPPTTSTAGTTTTTAGPVKPDSDKKPPLGHFQVKEGNTTCILLELRGRLEFTYTKMEGNQTKQAPITWDIPANGTATTSSGSCGKANSTTQRLDILFFDGWNLSFLFNSSVKNKNYDVEMITLTYILTDEKFPNNTNANETMTSMKDELTQYQVDSKKSFSCESKLTITDFKGGNLTNFFTWDVKAEAFRTGSSDKFSEAEPCDGDTKVSNLVPIIVGAALAGLVLIVLVAYLIGRQRNKRGYQSV